VGRRQFGCSTKANVPSNQPTNHALSGAPRSV
jgi:hypothetical protein